ncbi:ribosome silencing factor [Clostridium sp. KNHs216]|uniref:ribosome silencing factor n=1 Tax=Eubacteriales TaxID=186802 RepID=UPI00056DD4EC|nr:ribosome silencing factor [Clostridium sp. KNHs216]TQI65921.1 ribosome-associated protein [Clostridium sp. KNHs216]
MTSLELAKETVKILDEKKAMDLKAIGIKDISVLADYFVFSTGTSSTHVKSLAEEVEFKLKQLGVSPEHVDGYRSNSWVLLDYGNVMVHIFTADAREFYNLDRLWQDAEKIDISDIVKD